MQVTHQLLGPSEAFSYIYMTYPQYRGLLLQEGNDFARFLAWGASVNKRPVGLLLAEVNRKSLKARLLSIYTDPSFRGKGIARGLFSAGEAYLYQEACPVMLVNYSTSDKNHPLMEKWLQSQGWDGPKGLTTIVYVTCTADSYARFRQTPVGALGSKLPEGYHYQNWLDLPPQTLADLKEYLQSDLTVPPSESPFNSFSEPIDPCSMAILHQGQIIAWFLAHRLAPDRLRLSTLHLLKQHRGPKLLGLKLMNELMRWAYVAYKVELPITCVSHTLLENRQMQAYIQAILPAISHTEETRLMKKSLQT